MSSIGNFFRGVVGIVSGFLVVIVAVFGYYAFDTIASYIRQIPVVGDLIVDSATVLDFPGGRILFPALGIFLVVWAVALARKKSWARVVGIVIFAMVVVYLIAFAVLLMPFTNTAFFRQYRWWIVAIWFLLVMLFIYQLYALLTSKTERSFAAQYVGKPIVRTCDRCRSPLDQNGRCPKCEPEPQPAAGAAQVSRSAQQSNAVPRPQTRASRTQRVLARLSGESGTHEMLTSQLTVGREPDNDVVLDESSVSGRHAEIIHRQGQFAIRDVGSTNGTVVNGTRIAQSRLEDGAQIRFGRVEFRFDVAEQS